MRQRNHNPVYPASVGTVQIATIRVWLNAFIPRDIPQQTKIVTAGPHRGETMLIVPSPKLPCYLTDNRDFSAAPDAKSRMHSAIEIDVAKAHVVRQFHKCDPTTELDGETGEVTCNETADTSDMKFD